MDGLRGIAALIVACCHFVLAFRPDLLGGAPAPGSTAIPLLAATPAVLLWNPEFGVDVFFVLSGVVLANSAATGRASLPALLAGRWARLALPILGSSALIWLLVELGALRNAAAAALTGSDWLRSQFAWLAWQGNDGWQVVRQSLFDIFVTRVHWWNQALWTIPIEFLGSAGVFAAVLAWRCCGAGPGWLLAVALLATTVLHGTPYALFAAGTSLFALCGGQGRTGWRARGWIGLACAAVAVLAGGMPWVVAGGPYWRPFLWLSSWLEEPIPAVHAVGAVAAVTAALSWSPIRQLLERGLFQMLGRISYMLYLCHVVVLCTAVSAVVVWLTPVLGFDGASATGFGVYLATVVPAAALLTRGLDRPSVKAGRRVARIVDRGLPKAPWRNRHLLPGLRGSDP